MKTDFFFNTSISLTKVKPSSSSSTTAIPRELRKLKSEANAKNAKKKLKKIPLTHLIGIGAISVSNDSHEGALSRSVLAVEGKAMIIGV